MNPEEIEKMMKEQEEKHGKEFLSEEEKELVKSISWDLYRMMLSDIPHENRVDMICGGCVVKFGYEGKDCKECVLM